MRLLQNFKFFENSAAPQTSNVLVNSYNGSELTLQVSTGTATSLTIKVFTKADQQNGEFVDENTLNVNVNRLRKKLESIGIHDLIQTRVKMGYII